LLLGAWHENIGEEAVKWRMREREMESSLSFKTFMTVLGLINFIACVDTIDTGYYSSAINIIALNDRIRSTK